MEDVSINLSTLTWNVVNIEAKHLAWSDMTLYKSQHSSSKLVMSAQGTPRFPMIMPSHESHRVILRPYRRSIQSCGGSHERSIRGQCQAAAPSANCNLDWKCYRAPVVWEVRGLNIAVLHSKHSGWCARVAISVDVLSQLATGHAQNQARWVRSSTLHVPSTQAYLVDFQNWLTRIRRKAPKRHQSQVKDGWTG